MNKIVFALFALVAVASAGLLPNEPVPILSQDQDINPDGSFYTRYETGNGISYQETGALKTIGKSAGGTSQGTVTYTSPDGTPIKLSWVADENGYHAEGDHLPVEPEIPEGIKRALAYIAAHPYVEPKQH